MVLGLLSVSFCNRNMTVKEQEEIQKSTFLYLIKLSLRKRARFCDFQERSNPAHL